MSPIFVVIIAAVWLFILIVLKRAGLRAWYFLWGSMGVFIVFMIVFRPIITQPLARIVSVIAGLIGRIGDTFSAYFKYGILFIPTAEGAMTLTVDFECSGVIEILAFESLIVFFDVYTVPEKLVVGIGGFSVVMIANAVRISIICLAVHFFGPSAYYFTHTFVGRLFFYTVSIVLYFYVFTKPQVLKMKIGSFRYANTAETP